jgi:hypothetical protein
MDPTEIALINDGSHGHDMAWVNENVKMPEGFDPNKNSLQLCLDAGKTAIDWDNKYHAPGTKKLANGKYHGIGFQWTESWLNFPTKIPGQVSMYVLMEK